MRAPNRKERRKQDSIVKARNRRDRRTLAKIEARVQAILLERGCPNVTPAS